jgi:hypothetical protein
MNSTNATDTDSSTIAALKRLMNAGWDGKSVPTAGQCGQARAGMVVEIRGRAPLSRILDCAWVSIEGDRLIGRTMSGRAITTQIPECLRGLDMSSVLPWPPEGGTLTEETRQAIYDADVWATLWWAGESSIFADQMFPSGYSRHLTEEAKRARAF